MAGLIKGSFVRSGCVDYSSLVKLSAKCRRSEGALEIKICGSMCYGACSPTMTTCHPSEGEIENWLWLEPGDDTFVNTVVR